MLVLCCVFKKKNVDVLLHLSATHLMPWVLNFLRLHVKLKIFQLWCVPFMPQKKTLTFSCTLCGEACLHYRLHIATLRTQKNKIYAWHCQTCLCHLNSPSSVTAEGLICWGQRSLLVQLSFSLSVRMIPTLKELGLTFHFIMIINVNTVNFKVGADCNILHVRAIFKQEQ